MFSSIKQENSTNSFTRGIWYPGLLDNLFIGYCEMHSVCMFVTHWWSLYTVTRKIPVCLILLPQELEMLAEECFASIFMQLVRSALSFKTTLSSLANAKDRNTQPNNVVLPLHSLPVPIQTMWMIWQLIVPLPCSATLIFMGSTHPVFSPVSAKVTKRGYHVLTKDYPTLPMLIIVRWAVDYHQSWWLQQLLWAFFWCSSEDLVKVLAWFLYS